MYGLFLRALQGYVTSTYGLISWARVMATAGIPAEGFEPLLPYDLQVFRTTVDAASRTLEWSVEAMLEDVGTHLVTNPQQPAPRRLMRFGGASFADFLMSIEEMPDRARMALSDMTLPTLRLTECGVGQFHLSCRCDAAELGHMLLGILRSMADDYGALVMIDMHDLREGEAVLSVQLLDTDFAEGRKFDLAAVH